MARPSLAGVDLRLERAQKCLGLLNRLRRDFLTKPNEIVGYHDVEADEYVFRVNSEPPPLRWGLVVSEFAHCLRAGLDNMLWQLVLARGNQPGRHTQFPIYEHPTDKRGKSNTAKAEASTFGVLPDDFALIEAYQPYHAREDTNLSQEVERDIFAAYQPLAMLAYLNDVDKHRYVHAGFASARAMAILYGPMQIRPVLLVTQRHLIGWPDLGYPPVIAGSPEPWFWDREAGKSYEGWWSLNDDDPAEIARASDVRSEPGREAHVEMRGGHALEISFSDAKRAMSIFDLRDIQAEVEGIVEYFRPVIG